MKNIEVLEKLLEEAAKIKGEELHKSWYNIAVDLSDKYAVYDMETEVDTTDCETKLHKVVKEVSSLSSGRKVDNIYVRIKDKYYTSDTLFTDLVPSELLKRVHYCLRNAPMKEVDMIAHLTDSGELGYVAMHKDSIGTVSDYLRGLDDDTGMLVLRRFLAEMSDKRIMSDSVMRLRELVEEVQEEVVQKEILKQYGTKAVISGKRITKLMEYLSDHDCQQETSETKVRDILDILTGGEPC